jgi:hypothetical protein
MPPGGKSLQIDLKKEQRATLERSRYSYSFTARLFFGMMDLLTGSRTTLAKAKLIEMLASIPYRSWEIRQYARMTRLYRNSREIERAKEIMEWSRSAQDNEYWHLLVINEKMKEDGKRDPWYLFPPIPWLMIASYVLLTRTMALVNIKRAFLFNAEFEDHAEHVYATFVKDNPEWKNQPVENELVSRYGTFSTWADVFRRIGLDERDHMNDSFVLCGMPELVVHYEGMPAGPNL